MLFLWLHGIPDHVTDEEHTEAKQCDGEFGVVLLDNVLLSVGKVAEQSEDAVPDGGAEERVERERSKLHLGKTRRDGNQQ